MARRVLLLFFVVTLAVAASATRIQISEPACDPSAISIGPSALVDGFNPIGPVNGGGSFTFCNNTGELWTNLIIVINAGPTVTPADVICPSFDPVHDPMNTAHL